MWKSLFPWLLLCALLSSAEAGRIFHFDEPIDALSIGVQSDEIDLEVNGVALELEQEFDPLLRESNLVMFGKSTRIVRIRGNTKDYELHPIRVSKEPSSYQMAALTNLKQPRVLSRSQWGADESLLFEGKTVQRSDVNYSEEENGTPSIRVQQCQKWQKENPEDFEVTREDTKDSRGRTFRWPQRYSPKVKILTVHHTAIKVTGDKRPAYERMRALYQYHSNSRGWGDIGYHYVVDENGRVYEGRAGGSKVIGGHAYCSNVGTVGIALLGNFELEQPTQKQVKSLQQLLYTLAQAYKIDTSKQVEYHGIMMSPILGHRDLIATSCPGHNMYEVMGQVRKNVEEGNVDHLIRFPKIRKLTDGIGRLTSINKQATLTAVGSTKLTGVPGSQTRISLLYRAGEQSQRQRTRIATVTRSNSRIGLWQNMGNGNEMRVRKEILLPKSVQKNGVQILPLRIQFPRDSGTYTLKIGDVSITLNVRGKRANTASRRIPTSSTNISLTPQQSIVRPRPVIQRRTSVTEISEGEGIRIRLSYDGDTASISSRRGLKVEGNSSRYSQINLGHTGRKCIAKANGKTIADGIAVRVSALDDIVTIPSWKKTTNRFRGIVECRVVEGEFVLINELPLEDYMAGLAEEPDTEPWEKQRAFAIAARSYAAHYMDSLNRKFPDKPYDGDDSPARFQMYGGVTFENSNPGWVRAVKDTADQVIMKNGLIVKTPYYTSNDGRTRSPEERGWPGFPFTEVFKSKPDPWCNGMELRGHGVGMSGCGAKGQALEGKKAEEILEYYYPDTHISDY